MRLLIEVEGEEAVEFMEQFQGLLKTLEELSEELNEFKDQLKELVDANKKV
tara:strand:- start:371 stop:523 length:153 start_codon:yes stop_codon:yes gene_type:complete